MNIQGLSNKVEFYLSHKHSNAIKVVEGPIGWDEDYLEIKRHSTLHGVYSEYSNELRFTGEAEKFILESFEEYGINLNIFLTKYVLKTVDGSQKMVVEYIGIADYLTKDIDDDSTGFRFNSDNMMNILESFKSDTFEMDIQKSVQNEDIGLPTVNRIDIEGRTTFGFGETKLSDTEYENDETQDFQILTTSTYSSPGNNYLYGSATAITQIVSKGDNRHSSSDSQSVPYDDDLLSIPSNMFFVNSFEDESYADIKIDYISVFDNQNITNGDSVVNGSINVSIQKYRYLDDQEDYEFVESYQLLEREVIVNSVYNNSINGSIVINVAPNEGLVFAYTSQTPLGGETTWWIKQENLKVSITKVFRASNNLRFMFVSDIFSRLVRIMTGNSDSFYSRTFGRIEDGYRSDGEYGLIGVISGLWLRDFDQDSDKYKALAISLNDLMDSCSAVFNVGFSVELNNFKERFRAESLDYFYQSKTVVVLDELPISYSSKPDAGLYFSGVEVGYEKGGDYENEVGLDEPNVTNNYTTPIVKSDSKLNLISKIRADEVGMELVRRKPAISFPNEDTSGDEDNWFLDLKRVAINKFAQINWDDRLSELPRNISYPENFKSFLFTPLRMMLRHYFRLRACLETNLTDTINYASSNYNSKLSTKFIGDDNFKQENLPDGLLIDTVKRSRILPEVIKIKYNITKELIEQIRDTTDVNVNGVIESVPNAYFKFKFRDRNGNWKKGYLLGFKPGRDGEFTFQESNERTK